MTTAAGLTRRSATMAPSTRPADETGADAARFVGTALLLGAGLLAYQVTVRFTLAELIGGAWDWWTITLLRTQTTALAVATCLTLVDRRAAAGSRMRLHYIAAVLTGNLVAALATLALLHWTDLPYGGPSQPRWVLYIQIEYVLLTGGAVFALLDRRRAHAAQARLLAAQRGCLDAARRALGARLQTMQARVEPQFLFDTLASIHRLHALDAQRAERLLEELIAYLRAAMPRARDTSPTVRQEVDLVRAWLSIVGNTPEGGVDRCIDVAPEALEASIPPMLLLPLAKCVLAGRARLGPPPRYLRLAVAVAGTRLALRLVSNAWAGDAVLEQALASLRERLAALFGENASLVMVPQPHGGAQVVIDIPFEPAGLDAATAATDRSAS